MSFNNNSNNNNNRINNNSSIYNNNNNNSSNSSNDNNNNYNYIIGSTISQTSTTISGDVKKVVVFGWCAPQMGGSRAG